MTVFQEIESPLNAAPADRTKGSILLAEDADEMRTSLAMQLRQQGYQVTECRDGAELLAELKDYLSPSADTPVPHRFDLVISDVRMPGVFGTSIVEGVEAMPHATQFPPTILMTAFGDEETRSKARLSHVAAVFDKPFDVKVLLSKVRELLN